MPFLFEITAPDGTVSRVSPDRGLARVPAQPGAVYRIVDEAGGVPGQGARVLRYENDLVVTDLPGEDNFEIADFFSACTPEAPCQFSLAEIGGQPGETISPASPPAAALTQGGFLMAAPGSSAESLPTPPGSEFNWKPIAGIGGGLAIAAAGAGGGGGGNPDTTIPNAPSLETSITNDATPVIEGKAQPNVQITMTLTPGGTGDRVTFVTTADADGNWSIDTGSQSPSAGSLPNGGLPPDLATVVDLLATNSAGNRSDVTRATITVDLTPPDAVASLSTITDDTAPVTGTLTQDASTNDITPLLAGTLDQSLGSGERVEILRNGTVVGSATVDGLNWSFTDSPLGTAGDGATPSADGAPVSYTARVTDTAGNSSAASAAYRIVIDNVAPPAPTLAPIAGGDGKITLAEANAGVAVSGTTVANGRVDLDWGNGARTVTADAAGTFSTVFQTADLPTDGQVTLSAVAIDAAGNTSAAATSAQTLDRTPPGLTITAPTGAPFGAANLVTFTFTEPVTGFAVGDITLGGGVTAGAFDTVNASTYTLVVLPPTGAAGTATVTVNADVATDAVGNGNTSASFSRAFDTVPPTLTITDNVPGVANGNVTFTFDFGEPVSGFTSADIAVTNGTPGAFTGADGASVYTLNVAPPTNASGTMSVAVSASAAADAAGNANLAGNATQVFNTVALTVAIAPTAGAITPPPNGPVQYTITFSEPVSGLTLGDIAVVNGTAGNLVPTNLSGGLASTYTFDATPAANIEGNMTVSIGANAVQNAALTGNLAGASAPQPVDTLAPTVAITDDTAGTTNAPVTYTFTFSEAVTGFQAGDVTVVGADPTITRTLSGSGASYTMLITPAPNSTADLTVTVEAGSVNDASSNTNLQTSAPAQPVDTVSPALDLTAQVLPSDAVQFTFDFGEDVTGFTLTDVDILSTNPNFDTGTLTPVGGGTNDFTLVLTPLPGESGTFTVTVQGGVATDAVGNPNIGDSVSQAFNVPVVIVAPTTADADLLMAAAPPII
ncbi:MAG: Ig-like domain-containing protein [Burkholderiaceae bacterium]